MSPSSWGRPFPRTAPRVQGLVCRPGLNVLLVWFNIKLPFVERRHRAIPVIDRDRNLVKLMNRYRKHMYKHLRTSFISPLYLSSHYMSYISVMYFMHCGCQDSATGSLCYNSCCCSVPTLINSYNVGTFNRGYVRQMFLLTHAHASISRFYPLFIPSSYNPKLLKHKSSYIMSTPTVSLKTCFS